VSNRQTVDRWAKYEIIKAHLYNDHRWRLYELPEPNIPLNIAADGTGWWIKQQVCRQAFNVLGWN